jgi:TetR/AcrR family transcriptional regulator, mexJK operon transcriptional repressor
VPRLVGQIDQVKSEAILDAASDVLGERGLLASIEAIARRAGVSKQTIYNQFGCKTALIEALVARRVSLITAPLRMPGAAEQPIETLTALAQTLIAIVSNTRAYSLIRVTVQGAGAMPELAKAVFEAGPLTTRALIADFLATETQAGRMAVDDTMQAAELFAGMCSGHRQFRALLGLEVSADPAQISHLARTVAERFFRAYAP